MGGYTMVFHLTDLRGGEGAAVPARALLRLVQPAAQHQGAQLRQAGVALALAAAPRGGGGVVVAAAVVAVGVASGRRGGLLVGNRLGEGEGRGRGEAVG